VTRRRCEGKRRMWRRNRLGTFKCGSPATWLVTTQVGTSQTHYCCDEEECFRSIAQGYPASSRKIEEATP